MGTSVKFIEEHYGHMEIDKMARELNQDIDNFDEAGRILVDIESDYGDSWVLKME